MITIEPSGSPAASSLSKSALTRFLNRARQAAGLEGEVAVLLADDATLKRLNKTYRGKNKATDVLSFPAPEEMFAHGIAGDLAISLDTAAKQAEQFGHSLADELKILLLHGLLHLDGEDHETDSGEMALREGELRGALQLKTSLIDRVGKPSRRVAAPAQVSESSSGAPGGRGSGAGGRGSKSVGKKGKA